MHYLLFSFIVICTVQNLVLYPTLVFVISTPYKVSSHSNKLVTMNVIMCVAVLFDFEAQWEG